MRIIKDVHENFASTIRYSYLRKQAFWTEAHKDYRSHFTCQLDENGFTRISASVIKGIR